ncbi:MAG: DUF4160 domain-containing protein [Bacteroidetes bacterium]|nr:DUF4160 domain-containing protein [Bacteroidota bacterium]
MNTQIVHQVDAKTLIQAVDWNAQCERLIYATQDKNELCITMLDSASWTMIHSLTIRTDDKLSSIALNDSAELVLVTWLNKAAVYTISGVLVGERIIRTRGIQGGFAPGEAGWLAIAAPSGCVDWSMWDYRAGTWVDLELERRDHYGRGAAIHPSGMLVGACWNAYEAGFLLHKLPPVKNRLYYYDVTPACSEDQIEADGASFAARGDRFAFMTYDFHGGKTHHLCVYDLFAQGQPLLHLDIYGELQEKRGQTMFIGSDAYLVLIRDGLDIIQLSGAYEQLRLQNNRPDAVAGHTSRSELAVVNGTALVIIGLDGSTPTLSPAALQQASRENAERFMTKNADTLKMAGNGLMIRIVEADDESPEVYAEHSTQWAKYSLETQKMKSGWVDPYVQHEIDEWFAANQEEELKKWELQKSSEDQAVFNPDDISIETDEPYRANGSKEGKVVVLIIASIIVYIIYRSMKG